MKGLLAAAAVAAWCAMNSAPAAARDLPAGGMTATELAAWLRQAGYAAEVKPDPTTPGDQIVSSTIGGINYDIYLYGCSGAGDARRCADIQYAAGWTVHTPVGFEKINAWDRAERYGRSYLDDKGNVWIEYDLDISPGGTYELLDHSLQRWSQVAAKFKTTVAP